MSLDRSCRKCGLCETRALVVGPSGDLTSSLVLVGEAPGATEDRSGRPFVGKAGKMLDRLLRENGLPRESVMITNTVKCRPPENRRPTVEEVEACRPYLVEELKGRRLVVALGLTASEGLLGHKIIMKDAANKIQTVQIGGMDVDVLPTYHPSACLFNLRAREGLTKGIAVAMEFCGITRSQSIS